MKTQEEHTRVDEWIEFCAIVTGSYILSRFFKIALARGESMLPTVKHNHPVILDCRQSRKERIKAQDIIAFRPHLKGQHTFFFKACGCS